jgi:hypothetical protein
MSCRKYSSRIQIMERILVTLVVIAAIIVIAFVCFAGVPADAAASFDCAKSALELSVDCLKK